MPQSTPASLLDRAPEMSGAEMAASLVPPRQFAEATLESYRPDPDFPSQAEAVAKVRAFAESMTGGGRGFFGRRKGPDAKPGIYLDGGFGVGKTHLLAALWRLAPGRKYFGTFIEYTALVGALGYAQAVQLLTGASLVAIDEFELDDPGDTMMMTRLLGELAATGTRIAATSNTPPNALGEGRFAAIDFLREIQALSDRFDIVRIDGLDYRRREVEGHAAVTAEDGLETALGELAAPTTLDDFDPLLRHLSRVHPSRYVRIVAGLGGVGLRGVHTLTDQADALRFVAFVDRLYDEQVPVRASGTPLDEVFGEEMLVGGYRKKYLRAISRLIALTS
ncbi:cell division protein ZapE [Protaetiibacter intestinalis]|uniref:Cell division protein ZapE n=1 Tax=Protaetiibacter intestinalis TaxID=2419774 RepID=A0A387BKW1_9MICO|nr:cell division protein ZapE [Protaetiibacter intestinalis]AYF99150.1 cell division protein ZapE [Protaetiibacter intestinalis]